MDLRYVNGVMLKESEPLQKTVNDFVTREDVKRLSLYNIPMRVLESMLKFEITDTNGWQGDIWFKGKGFEGFACMYNGTIELEKTEEQE